MKTIENIIKDSEEIIIISGEGEMGTEEEYNGKRSLRAIKLRLTKEKCGGNSMGKAEKTWGGAREGAGRPATGRKRQYFYITDEENEKLRELLEKLRA